MEREMMKKMMEEGKGGEETRFEELRELLRRNRSYRRFDERRKVGVDELRELVGLARLCASGRNLQPLKYRLVTDERECAGVFKALAWAGYYTDWAGPEEGERPTAYAVQCLDERLAKECLCDDGLQLEAITLGATAKGLGCCIIKAFREQEVREALGLPGHLRARYVVAVGKPAEKVVLEDMDGSAEASYRYYRDAEGAHHVPKRPLDEITV